MARWRGHDSQARPVPRGKIHALPGLESYAVPTQPTCTLLGGEHCFRVGEQGSTRAVEIIKMVIVAEEHVIQETYIRGA
jgi:hypothetical protein